MVELKITRPECLVSTQTSTVMDCPMIVVRFTINGWTNFVIKWPFPTWTIQVRIIFSFIVPNQNRKNKEKRRDLPIKSMALKWSPTEAHCTFKAFKTTVILLRLMQCIEEKTNFQWHSIFCKQMPSQTLDGSTYPCFEFGGKFKNSY